MSIIKTMRYGGADLIEPTAIIGFPTVGLVGSILSSYICKEMKMDLVAGITSGSLPPYALISNGLPYPPIRLFGHKGSEPGGDILVVTSEVTPKPEDCYDMALKLLDVLQDMNVKRTYILEGSSQNDTPKAVVCGTDDGALEFVNGHGVSRLTDGLVRGITGVMLYEGKEMKMDILALMCPANPNMPDPRASAAALELLSKMIPGLSVGTAPLLKEADEIEARIRDEMQNAPLHDDSRNLYG